MATPEIGLRDALYDLVGHRVSVVEKRSYSYSDLRELYGSNAKIADAAGVKTAAQARRARLDRYPKARKETLAKIERKARRDRNTFLKALERYQSGENIPQKYQPLLDRLGQEEVTRQRTFSSLESVMESIRRNGITVLQGPIFTLLISQTEWTSNARTPAVAWRPSTIFFDAVEHRDWGLAQEEFFAAWADAYGIQSTARGQVGVIACLDVEYLPLAIGLRATTHYTAARGA